MSATGTGIRPVVETRSCTWRALGVEVRLVVSESASIADARAVLADELAALDVACSRFRDDSEIAMIDRALGRRIAISPRLTEAIGVSLDAAEMTGGDLDPTLGHVMSSIGYDRDFRAVRPYDRSPVVTVRRRADWTGIDLDRAACTVRVPAGVQLDLGATAKAWGADRAAERVQATVGGPVLVGLGGDLAFAGPTPPDGWPVRVQDRPDGALGFLSGVEPAQTVAVRDGGLATSSVAVRRWRRAGVEMHHLLDPRTGLPALTPWRTVSVVAPSCLIANILSTTTIVRGEDGWKFLQASEFSGRLVSHDGGVTTVNGWPAS